MAAEGLQPAAVSDEIEVHSGQRELSTAERNELARIVKDLRRPIWPAILLTLWFSLVAGGYLISGRTPESGDLLRVTFLGVVALLNDVVYITRLNRARRMAEDLRQGILLILRYVTKAAPTDETDGDSVQDIEVLPRSRATWTEQGKPASWRTSDSWLSVPRRMQK